MWWTSTWTLRATDRRNFSWQTQWSTSPRRSTLQRWTTDVWQRRRNACLKMQRTARWTASWRHRLFAVVFLSKRVRKHSNRTEYFVLAGCWHGKEFLRRVVKMQQWTVRTTRRPPTLQTSPAKRKLALCCWDSNIPTWNLQTFVPRHRYKASWWNTSAWYFALRGNGNWNLWTWRRHSSKLVQPIWNQKNYGLLASQSCVQPWVLKTMSFYDSCATSMATLLHLVDYGMMSVRHFLVLEDTAWSATTAFGFGRRRMRSPETLPINTVWLDSLVDTLMISIVAVILKIQSG